jgi:hypothetical protein
MACPVRRRRPNCANRPGNDSDAKLVEAIHALVLQPLPHRGNLSLHRGKFLYPSHTHYLQLDWHGLWAQSSIITDQGNGASVAERPVVLPPDLFGPFRASG